VHLNIAVDDSSLKDLKRYTRRCRRRRTRDRIESAVVLRAFDCRPVHEAISEMRATMRTFTGQHTDSPVLGVHYDERRVSDIGTYEVFSPNIVQLADGDPLFGHIELLGM
jgi:hypothetical protein